MPRRKLKPPIKRVVTPSPDAKPLRAAIYARVSTTQQDYDLQLRELSTYCERMGWEVVRYQEKASSVKKRPELDRLMADAKLKRFDVVAVWKIDRFARSLLQLIDLVQSLDHYGVRFLSLTQGIDTDRRNPSSRLLLQIMGAFAEFERSLIVERVTAGRRAYVEAFDRGEVGRSRHSKSGRDMPAHRPRKIWNRQAALDLRAQGSSLREIAKKLGVSTMSVKRALDQLA